MELYLLPSLDLLRVHLSLPSAVGNATAEEGSATTRGYSRDHHPRLLYDLCDLLPQALYMESHGIYVALSASGGHVCKAVATLSEGEYRRGRSGAKHGRDRICEWHGRSDRTLGRGYRGRHRNISRRVKALAYADGSQLGVVNNAVAPWMWSLLSVIQYDRMANNIAKNFCPQPRGGATLRNPT